jgi:hypothetical protein
MVEDAVVNGVRHRGWMHDFFRQLHRAVHRLSGPIGWR